MKSFSIHLSAGIAAMALLIIVGILGELAFGMLVYAFAQYPWLMCAAFGAWCLNRS